VEGEETSKPPKDGKPPKDDKPPKDGKPGKKLLRADWSDILETSEELAEQEYPEVVTSVKELLDQYLGNMLLQ
jgi:hypothetical protein